MRLRGFEPPRALAHGDLNAARLPVPPQPQNARELIAWRSGLDADVLEQEGDVVAAIEPDRTLVPARAQPELAARRLAQVEDVARAVRELVADVLVTAGPVHEDAAVGADEPAQQRPRRRVHERALPGLEHDRPVVLLAAMSVMCP